MNAAFNGKGTAFALTLAATALAGMAFVAAVPVNAGVGDGVAATPETAAGAAALRLTRGLTAVQAARGLRYQCMRDFRHCTRDIEVSSSWSVALAQGVFDAEYSSCCFEANLCGEFLDSLGDAATAADYQDDLEVTCVLESPALPEPASRAMRMHGAVDAIE